MSLRMLSLAAVMLLAISGGALAETFLGNTSRNSFDPNSIYNRFGAGSRFNPNSVNNSFGTFGSPFSNRSANNPYANDAPKLFDRQDNYRGRLSANPYDPDSTSNPYGRYGSRFSPDSINNPYGAGSRYGQPLTIWGAD